MKVLPEEFEDQQDRGEMSQKRGFPLTYGGEQDGLLRKIHGIEKAMPAPVDQAIDMLRVTSRSSDSLLEEQLKSSAARTRKVLQKKRRMLALDAKWKLWLPRRDTESL